MQCKAQEPFVPLLQAPNLAFYWLQHGFGDRDSVYPDSLSTVKQIHSDVVIDAAGRTGFCGEGDALISQVPGIKVGVKTADCVPILIADVEKRAVAAIHAGWRGTAANIVTRAVSMMAFEFGSNPADMRAAIGPAIGGCCYEVSPDVAKRFTGWAPELADVDSPTRINLARINQLELIEAGVGDIWTADLCTRCGPGQYWSFRRDSAGAGRQMSFIGLK